jgi:hypothetical protein
MGVVLCRCGCGNPAPIAKFTNRARGNVAGKAVKYIRGHWPGRKDIHAMYAVDTDTGCWNWQGHLTSGYGRIGSRLVYRLLWEAQNGPQPDDREMQLDHLCKNRACVNPNHLQLVTRAENVRRGAKTLLSLSDVHVAHQRLKAGDSIGAIARDLGVSYHCIWGIHRGRSWRDVWAQYRHGEGGWKVVKVC